MTKLQQMPQAQAQQLAVNLLHEKIAEFCQKYSIDKLCLFGSLLRSDFRSDSDDDETDLDRLC